MMKELFAYGVVARSAYPLFILNFQFRNEKDMLTNITKRFYFRSLAFLIFLTLSSMLSFAQQTETSRPDVTENWKIYKQQVETDPDKRMVELKTVIPGVVYDLRYASTNNFMQRRMYPRNTRLTFLRAPAATALAEVQKELNEKGLGLKIFDAYRPYSVTVAFWELVKDERYVANPAKGSGHNRGVAVDLTIIQLKTGEELDMGTGFDNFTDTAHHGYSKLPETVLQNRLLLKSLMEKNGFQALDSEWWHYYLKDWNKFELLDLDFKKLRKQF